MSEWSLCACAFVRVPRVPCSSMRLCVTYLFSMSLCAAAAMEAFPEKTTRAEREFAMDNEVRWTAAALLAAPVDLEDYDHAAAQMGASARLPRTLAQVCIRHVRSAPMLSVSCCFSIFSIHLSVRLKHVVHLISRRIHLSRPRSVSRVHNKCHPRIRRCRGTQRW